MNNSRIVYSRLLPFAAYILFLALNDPLISALEWLHLDHRLAYLLRIVVVAGLLMYFWRDYIELKIKPVTVDFVYAGVAGCIVFIIWIFPYPDWLGGSDALGFNPNENAEQLSALIWSSIRLMGAALVVPIMEELFWRSFIMRWFDRPDFLSLSPERISGYAYLGSACLFAAEHHLWLAGFFAGLIYGELYKNYKNLWIPIFAHAVTNSLLGIWVLSTGSWNYW
ncbi:MAG TPA: CAAX prenyl protease-related protein [Methylophilaceae bacterium]|nr:CAAX prenyl protease-related protein [Methylophilaceae bacterium]HAJ72060.1 CAAX prenyl protease-related protein [Methylophilaceae bacterium]